VKTIHKHHLPTRKTDVESHQGARVLHVAEQHDLVTVWTEVDTSRPIVGRRFYIVPTGGRPPASATYAGTALLHDGAFVFHVYDEGDQ